MVTQFTHTVPKFVSKVAGLQVHATTPGVRVVNRPLTFVFLQLLVKRFIQAEARKTFHNSNIPKRLSKLLFFSMAVATYSGTILVSCWDSDVGPIYGCSGHSEVLHNQFGPFNEICGNLPMVQPLFAESAWYSFAGAYYQSQNLFNLVGHKNLIIPFLSLSFSRSTRDVPKCYHSSQS